MKKLILILILFVSLKSQGQTAITDSTQLATYIADSLSAVNDFSHAINWKVKRLALSLNSIARSGGGGGSSTVDTAIISTKAFRDKLRDSIATLYITGNGTANYIPYYSTARVVTSSARFNYLPTTGTLYIRGVASTDNALLINTSNDLANAHILKTNGTGGLALPAGTDLGIGVSTTGVSGAKLVVKGDATNAIGGAFRGNADANIALVVNTANDANNRHRFYSNGDAMLSMGSGTTQIGTAGTNTGVLKLTGSTSGTVSIQPANTAGTWTLTLPADGGTSGYYLSTNGSGVTSWGIIAENTYTPTLTNTTNVAASTAAVTYYQRIGDVVHVWGTVDIDATSALTISEMGLSLPVASGVGQVYEISGTGSFEDNTIVQITGDPTNDRAKFRFTPQSATNNKYSFHFTYKYIAP